MDTGTFKAYVVEQANGDYTGNVKNKNINDLPEGDLLIKVHYSSTGLRAG